METADVEIEPSGSPQDRAEVVTTRFTSVVSALFDPTADDAPTAPIESPATWTLAAAARRDFVATPNLDQAVAPVTNSLTTGAAVEQRPPLALLQQLPFIGPTFVTPIVAIIHQIPIVSDILHPFIGYPTQAGLPAGTPVSRDVWLTSFDGTRINVHFMPAPGLVAGQTAPTILAGPGLGMPGATNLHGTLLDDILTDTFGLVGVGTLRQAGYNVVTWDPRGEYFSGGQLEINSPEFEGRDTSAIISWLATQPEARLDSPGDPRMGMVGISYGGGIQLVTASMDKRVDAIVPSIAYHSLTTALYRNEAFRSSWATLLVGVLNLTLARVNPQILPTAIYGDLTGQLRQFELDILNARNPLVGNITAPTLLINGTVDTIFSLQQVADNAEILIANAVPTKVVWFCGGHGVCANNLFDLRDGALIEQRTLEWLARYVKGDASVPTGPQFEWVDQGGQWFSSDVYPVPPGSPIVASTTGRTLPLLPYILGSGFPFIPFALPAANAINLTVPAATTTTYVVGAPKLTLTYSGTGSSRHVYAQLVSNTTGLVLGSIVTPIPVTLDGRTHTVTTSLEPVAHTLAPGETVTLQLVSSAGLYETIIPSLGVLHVSSMQLTLPTANAAAVSPSSATAVTLAA